MPETYCQVEIADCMQTLFRGNSLASKIMAYCFKIYGHGYLRELLNGLVSDMFIAAEKLGLSYEVDPARYVILLHWPHISGYIPVLAIYPVFPHFVLYSDLYHNAD